MSCRNALFAVVFWVAVACFVGSLLKHEPQRVVEVQEVVWTSRGDERAARADGAGITAQFGYRVELFAAEPLLAHPVAFALDAQGNCYVAECHRRREGGIGDNRHNPEWVDDDLAAQTVDDRRKLLHRHQRARLKNWQRGSEKLRLIRDDDGDGVADRSTVFAEGFDDILTGAAAGVLPLGDRVLFTCIPDLWELRDGDGDGRADERRSMAHGFAARKLSGPPSITQPSTTSVTITPPNLGRRSTRVHGTPARLR